MIAPEERLMTVTELAEYLQLGEKTVLRMLKQKQIPGVKIGNQWRFSKPVIDDWILSKMQVVPKNDLSKLIESSPEIIPLSRLIEPQHVVMDITAGSKQEVLRRLITPLLASGHISDADNYLSLLLNREAMMPTAVGRVAFPHIRNPHENEDSGPIVVVGICREGCDFGAPDGQKTSVLLLPYSDSHVVHLRIMAKIAALFRDDRAVEALLAAKSGEQVIGILIGLERATTEKK